MNLTEVLNLLMVILTLLGLILEVVRLTVEVMDKNSQKKNDDNKKRLTASSLPNRAVNLLTNTGQKADLCSQRPSVYSITFCAFFVKTSTNVPS